MSALNPAIHPILEDEPRLVCEARVQQFSRGLWGKRRQM
jgi:hypothetical protein